MTKRIGKIHGLGLSKAGWLSRSVCAWLSCVLQEHPRETVAMTGDPVQCLVQVDQWLHSLVVASIQKGKVFEADLGRVGECQRERNLEEGLFRMEEVSAWLAVEKRVDLPRADGGENEKLESRKLFAHASYKAQNTWCASERNELGLLLICIVSGGDMNYFKLRAYRMDLK